MVRGHRVEDAFAERERGHVSLRERRIGRVIGGEFQLCAGEIDPHSGRRRRSVTEDGCPMAAPGVEEARRRWEVVEKVVEDRNPRPSSLRSAAYASASPS